MTAESKYIMALSYVKGLGSKSVKKLLQNFDSAEEIWKLSNKGKNSIVGLNLGIAEQIGSAEIWNLVERELEISNKYAIKISTWGDVTYPKMLQECVDAPPVVFQKGNINLEHGKFVAVVGTRKMTARGKEFVHELIKDLRNQPITIVSGLALGVDAEAHKAAIENDLQTIGVLAHGLNQIYPKSNEKIGIEMQEKGGLFTEFSSFHMPEAVNFLRRNRIIAGLCHATIVVESAIAGGAMSTATHANNYNRDVFAVPGRVTDVTSMGCHYLIKNHKAFLLTEANDLLKYLNIAPKKERKSLQKELFVDLTAIEQKVYNLLRSHGKKHIDFLAIESGMASYQLMPILLDLELKNLVEPLPGKFYDIV
ncbi:DNA-protecting protein DprA [Flavobacteriaceae bacterium Ap0902]|nr:DNA-protecting protein DprA [Flavobacteriaceae bacterium Ap0902]